MENIQIKIIIITTQEIKRKGQIYIYIKCME